MDGNSHVIEQFYGVYLLYCENPQFKGRTYIGFTVDPNRRIKQHNKGRKFGGAWKTSNRGPWKMVLIIHGFPNEIAALRFEWAWQHPHTSRRLNHLPKKKNNERMFDYLLRIVSEMLRIGPWNRLPLTIRWLEQEYARDFHNDRLPPIHMPICYGKVVSKKLPKSTKSSSSSLSKLEKSNQEDEDILFCFCCKNILNNDNKIECLAVECDMIAHFECLSKLFLDVGEYVPIEGDCPKCCTRVLWGDLVRKSQGCYKDLDQQADDDSDVYSELSDDSN
ncbi:structure-specific endonuclease subunit slx1 [Chrysoperla carnea]|uniref:structure-specific endonuclease subunit slx1 n=1 Tax=Chrysoperla carnea TaxID=189513 RepID=UPI001D06CCA5|nr:structure-specific endonuclease subunit slx1 [Chrysoperla carnea]XP_044738758.1 structure-specific endonuclease subunit slx1 [Chrysoperla carnea]